MDLKWVSTKAACQYQVPNPPNFIKVRYPSTTEDWVDVKLFTEEELREIGKRYTEALLEHAKKRAK